MIRDKLKTRFIYLSCIVANIISFALIALYFILFPLDENHSLLDSISSSESLSLIFSVFSFILTIVIETLSLIHLHKENKQQQKMVETLLIYNKLSNKGDEHYQTEINKLFSEEILTSAELKKVQKIHADISTEQIDSSEDAIRKEIESLHRILGKISLSQSEK